MPRTILAFCFRLLGVSAMAIGGTNFVFGIAATIAVFDIPFVALGFGPSVSDGFRSPSVDSEFRFYSVFWVAYGALLWRAAGILPAELGGAGWLIALFGIGGVGRAISHLVYGSPAPLFVALTWVEIALAILMAWLWWTLGREARP